MTDPLNRLSPRPVDESPSPSLTERLRARITAIEARSLRTRGANGPEWHLAQLNLGRTLFPLDAPEMEAFVSALDRINAIADASPGFVWRLKGEDGQSSSYIELPGIDDDPLLASNLSVWTSLDALRDFMYRTDHASYLRRRAEWFDRDPQPMTVAWWIPAGTIPTLEDALRRLDYFREHGPSETGFALGRTIPQPPHPHERPTPMSSQTFVPYLTVADSRAALQFYGEVFGARQSGELFEMDDGRIGHAEMSIGDQILYMADEFPDMNLATPSRVGANSVSLVINVDDCDAVYAHALAAGATGERPPADQHGQRQAWFVDPWGHRWSPTSQSAADTR